jgi:hypothetical protein
MDNGFARNAEEPNSTPIAQIELADFWIVNHSPIFFYHIMVKMNACAMVQMSW